MTPEPQPTPPRSPDLTETEILAEFDRTVERKAREGVISLVPEDPPPPKPPDHHAVIDVGVEMIRTGELPAGTDLTTAHREIDVDFSDPDAVREGLRSRQAEQTQAEEEHAAGRVRMEQAAKRQRLDELEREDARESALDAALELLEEGSNAEIWDAAIALQTRFPDVLPHFLAEWSEMDVMGANTWAVANPAPPPPPPIDVDAVAAQAAAFQEHQRQEDIREAFTNRVSELEGEPRAAKALPGAIETLRRALTAEAMVTPGSPDEAVFMLEQAVRLSDAQRREEADARRVARLLGGLDEALHRAEYLRGEDVVEPRLLRREDFEDAIVAERVTPDRVVGRAYRRTAAQETEDFLAEFDRHTFGTRYEGRAPDWGESGKQIDAKPRVERERRAGRR
jgi:hypothetical protein